MQQEAKHARDKAGALDSKLQNSQEKNAAQHEQLVQLQAEVEYLQQQVQVIQVVMMLIACTMQVYGQASAGYSVYVQHCHLLSSSGHLHVNMDHRTVWSLSSFDVLLLCHRSH